MAAPEILLTEEQRLEFTQVSPDISEWEMAKYYTFTDYDHEIINRHRRDYNKLGFAVQLAMLRYPGWTFLNVDSVPPRVLSYISDQVDALPEEIVQYAQRDNTRLEHLQEIREVYGYTNFTDAELDDIKNLLIDAAMTNENAIYLVQTAIDYLRSKKVILPGITTIERVVVEARAIADEKVIKIINDSITQEQRIKLNEYIETQEEDNITLLAWLKEDPCHPSPKEFSKVIERLEKIRELKLNVNIEGIHPNRIRQLSRLGSKYEPYSFRRFEENKRYAMLALYLYDLSQTLVDRAIEINDRLINEFFSKGRKEQEEIQKQNGKALNEKIVYYASLVKALVKAKNEGLDPFQTIEASVMPWDKLITSGEEAEKLSRPVDYDYLDLLDNRYNYLRRYTPELLKFLEFRSNNNNLKPLIEAINVINDMNANNKKSVPYNAPVAFVPNRWNKYVFKNDGTINKHYYEMAALAELRNRIRSGDVSVVGSKNYKDFDEYLVSKEEWDSTKHFALKLAVGLSVDEFLSERKLTLHKKLEWVSKNIGKLEGISLDNSGIHVSKLEKDVPDEAVALSRELYSLLPKIKLPELLVEVSNWTGFERYFVHASTGSPPKPDEIPIIMATLMAMGTNIGLMKMSDSTPGITYRQMANTAQWRMYDDAMNKSQAVLVNYQHKQLLASYWGDGTYSSSDGMRVQVGVSSMNADHNPHFGSEKGNTMYRFVSDQQTTYYVKIINTNDRDAIHIIDGLLGHETELNITHHSTDTAGYTDLVFGLTHLLGFKFEPRIRDISDLKLYTFAKPSDYSKLENILNGRINEKTIRECFDDVLRLAHSIQKGKTTASLIMGKLGSYARQNTLATALREMGRIEKTIFILDYISSQEMRRKINKILNKGELMNSLARAVFFAKRGEMRERDLQDQLQRASALSIIMNAISVWNTVYLQKAIDYLKTKKSFDNNLLRHVSSLNWEHINFIGDYHFDSKTALDPDKLRPLNIENF